ncbi:MAG: hypothetical protein U9R08_02815 [Nanoarchaeota archaeon]|nr:hypothetical protein [Nanoarchaeota archaeon]
MQIQGIVQGIETKSGVGAKGPWTMYKITINGLVYTTFNQTFASQLQIGQNASFDYNEKQTVKNGRTYTNRDIITPQQIQTAQRPAQQPVQSAQQVVQSKPSESIRLLRRIAFGVEIMASKYADADQELIMNGPHAPDEPDMGERDIDNQPNQSINQPTGVEEIDVEEIPF